jgi:hypothetical protein
MTAAMNHLFQCIGAALDSRKISIVVALDVRGRCPLRGELCGNGHIRKQLECRCGVISQQWRTTQP